jgi:hypothetical protein
LSSRSKGFGLLLLLRAGQFLPRDFGLQSSDSRLLFLDVAVLFEELIQLQRPCFRILMCASAITPCNDRKSFVCEEQVNGADFEPI